MKRVQFIPILFFIMISCGKEQNNPTRELNISLKSMESVGLGSNDTRVFFYPNPFQGEVSVNISGGDSATMLISNDAGGIKRITFKGRVMLDFSEESSGAYYCEVLVNQTVFRTYLIKK